MHFISNDLLDLEQRTSTLMTRWLTVYLECLVKWFGSAEFTYQKSGFPLKIAHFPEFVLSEKKRLYLREL